jgi:hypothetical protein
MAVRGIRSASRRAVVSALVLATTLVGGASRAGADEGAGAQRDVGHECTIIGTLTACTDFDTLSHRVTTPSGVESVTAHQLFVHTLYDGDQLIYRMERAYKVHIVIRPGAPSALPVSDLSLQVDHEMGSTFTEHLNRTVCWRDAWQYVNGRFRISRNSLC